VDNEHPQPSSRVCTIDGVGTFEHHDPLVLGNCGELHGVMEIFINYTSSEELFDHKTMVVNPFFSTMMTYLDPKSIVECQ
jgi:hypothetical protein